MLDRVVLFAGEVDVVDGVLARCLYLVGDVLVDHLGGASAHLVQEITVASELLRPSLVVLS